MTTRLATMADIPVLVSLINSAYRATEGIKGWTYEGHLLEGLRTDEAHLQSLLLQKDHFLLICTEGDSIVGSVSLEVMEGKLYFGMLSVDPRVQSRGIGTRLVHSSIAFAKEHHCSVIQLTVLSVRQELIDWYQRCGFKPTGELIPFPEGEKFGKSKMPLELLCMELNIE